MRQPGPSPRGCPGPRVRAISVPQSNPLWLDRDRSEPGAGRCGLGGAAGFRHGAGSGGLSDCNARNTSFSPGSGRLLQPPGAGWEGGPQPPKVPPRSRKPVPGAGSGSPGAPGSGSGPLLCNFRAQFCWSRGTSAVQSRAGKGCLSSRDKGALAGARADGAQLRG